MSKKKQRKEPMNPVMVYMCTWMFGTIGMVAVLVLLGAIKRCTA